MKFSVCIPSTHATTLSSTIESIRRQTWTNWELIVIGQGADSSVRLMVEKLAALDHRIRYVHSNESGARSARNAGMSAATGLVTFINDNCKVRNDWLQMMHDYFNVR